MNDQSREYTAEEVLAELLAHVRHLAAYWASLPDKTPLERTEGMAHSMLAALDGKGFMPAFDLVLRPHPDDKLFHIGEGENYYVDGMAINSDCHMSSILYYQVPS